MHSETKTNENAKQRNPKTIRRFVEGLLVGSSCVVIGLHANKLLKMVNTPK